MAHAPSVEDCLAALERLVRRHGALTEDEATAIGRLLTGDAAFRLAPPAPPPAPPAPAADAGPARSS